jgi:HAE1 family hydrophobic/amphiphilic exporter-1
MSLAELSIKRPVFISSIITIMLIVGYICLIKMPVNLFPDTDFPIVSVYTPYQGAAPAEVEVQISKIIENEVSTISNLKSIKSISKEGISIVVAEFNLDANIQDAKRQVNDKIDYIKNKLPKDASDPMVRNVDPSSKEIIMLSLTGDMSTNELYTIADDYIKTSLEQAKDVGLVEIWGGRQKEILVGLDRNKLKQHNISASAVVRQIDLAGENIPLGKYPSHGKEVIYRTIGEYSSIDSLNKVVVNFLNNDVPITVADVAEVKFHLLDESNKTYINGKPSVFIYVYRQSGANIIEVVDAIKKKIPELNNKIKNINSSLDLMTIRDDAKLITANVEDVKETIFIGIILTILVVFFFLGSLRSTIITGLALPNSLLGAFILMYLFGFSINVMSLLALSLAIGLLIDDAIVVRENIFRHIENGTNPATASVHGTREVTLAVIGTSLTILAVFGPVAFLYGIVGQFFKEFGLTICFAMIISLFDALTIAPMMSTYFSGKVKTKEEIKQNNKSPLAKFLNFAVTSQEWLESKYINVLKFSIKHPIIILVSSGLIFVASIFSVFFLSKTFLPAQEHGEFNIKIELPAGSTLEQMDSVAQEVTTAIRTIPEIETVMTLVGGNASHKARFSITLIPDSARDLSTTAVKDLVREKLKPFDYANPLVTDVDMVGAGLRPFNLTLSGPDDNVLDNLTEQVFNYLNQHPGLNGAEITNGKGNPEIQVKIDNKKADLLGISSKLLGQELRTQIDGTTVSKMRKDGTEYDIRVRVQENQRDLEDNFDKIYIPNINQTLLKLSSFSELVQNIGPAAINRQNKAKYTQIAADINPDGPGMAKVMSDIDQLFKTTIILPAGFSYKFMGQSESFNELIENMIIALCLGLLFIYLVLASLYESYILPLTIMLVIPLALIGAFFSLLITQHSLDLFSMIGCILLLGLATKNSILLVDYANQKMQQGSDRIEAIIAAGQTRLRPILMTTVALIAGMIPVAIGINEASKQRTSMGIAIIGGLISSTILTLVVIPAAFIYIDKMRAWGRKKLKLDLINKNI